MTGGKPKFSQITKR